jgi:hypothetical protein
MRGLTPRSPGSIRWPALLLTLLLVVGAITPSLGASLRLGDPGGSAPRAASAELPEVTGDDACVLLSDEEVLLATGATSVLSRTPGSQAMQPAGCTWQLEPAEPGSDAWTLNLGVALEGGRQPFDDQLEFFGGNLVPGIGDAAAEMFGAWNAVKGETFVTVQMIAFGGNAPRSSSDVGRMLIWLVMSRIPGGGTGPAASPSPAPPAADVTRSLVERLRADQFGPDVVDATVELLARSGIATYAGPTDGAPLMPVAQPASPMALLLDQVRPMALEAWSGGGMAGSDLDPLVDAPSDLASASEVLAGYVAAGETDGADIARALIGEIGWAAPETTVFPQLVLILFTSDLARETLREAAANGIALRPEPARAIALAITRDARTAQAGACSLVANFVSDVISRVFEALRVSLPEGKVARIFVSIWNFLVSVAELAARQIVRLLTKPVLDLIAGIAGTVGLVASIVSAVRPWAVSVTVEPPITAKGVGGSRGQPGTVVVRVDLGGLDDWPAHVKDCAAVAGRPLPNLKPEGAPVTWTPIAQAPGDLVAEGTREGKLDAQGVARLAFTTLVDDVKEPFTEHPGIITGRVTIDRPGLKELRDQLAGMLLQPLPDIARGPVWSVLKPVVDRVTGQLTTLASSHASGAGAVIFHVAAATPPPNEKPRPAAPRRAVRVHLDRPASPGVQEGTVLDLISCTGPYGTWRGVFRIGGLDPSGGTLYFPFASVPVTFTFRGAGGIRSATVSTDVMFPTNVAEFFLQLTLSLRFIVDGTTMTMVGEARMDGATVAETGFLGNQEFSRIPIEPAPAGRCP